MMIDDDTLKQLLRINDELLAAMQVAERKARYGNFISSYTSRGLPTHILIEAGKNKLQ
jgi:hypothetical protein